MKEEQEQREGDCSQEERGPVESRHSEVEYGHHDDLAQQEGYEEGLHDQGVVGDPFDPLEGSPVKASHLRHVNVADLEESGPAKIDHPIGEEKEIKDVRDRTEISNSHQHLRQNHGRLPPVLGRNEADHHRAKETS